MLKKILQNPLIKHSSIVFAGSMTSNVMAWMYHLFVGRILGPAQYGELAALLSLFYIIAVPANVLQIVLVKFFSVIKAVGDYGQAKRLLQLTTKWMMASIGIGFVCIILIVPYITKYLQIQSEMNIIWLYLIFATFLISVGNNSAFLGFQMFTASSIYGNIGMLMRLLIGLAFSFWGVGWTLIANIFSNIISYILTFIPLRFIFSAESHPLAFTKHRAIGYSIPSFFTSLGLTALYSQDVLLVKHFFSSQEAGIYASLSVLGKVIFFSSSAISTVLFPLVSERKELKKSYFRVIWTGLGIIGIMCLFLTTIYFIFPRIVILLFGPTFNGAVPFLGKFAVFMSFFSLSSILLNVLLALEKPMVGIFTISAAVVQFITINVFHTSIQLIIELNTLISFMLLLILIVYFQYDK